MLKAVNRCQYTNDAEDADGNAKQRKKSTEFVLPQFLQGHFKTAGNYFYGAANHKTNLPQVGEETGKYLLVFLIVF